MQLGLSQQDPTDIPLKDIVIAYLTQTPLKYCVSKLVCGWIQWMVGIPLCSRRVTPLTMPKIHGRIDRRDPWEQIRLGENPLEPDLIGTTRMIAQTKSTESGLTMVY